MEHKDIKNKLILYLDGDLSDKDAAAVKEHLSGCRSCEQEIRALAAIWKDEDKFVKVKSSSYLWTRLEARLNEKPHSILGKLIPAVRLTVIATMVLAAVFLGRYLGNMPAGVNENESGQYFWDAYYLDVFEPIPAETIGKAYTSLTSEAKQ
jgi:anti-sigma factor RsiW